MSVKKDVKFRLNGYNDVVIYAENRAVDSVKGVGYSEYEKECAAFRIWLRFGKKRQGGRFFRGVAGNAKLRVGKKTNGASRE